ncbi:zinc finger Ran-binding domain-containing protein [Flaviaesturariibacter terrae]
MTCPHCTAFNDASATVCRQCGKPLHEGDLFAPEQKPERRVSDTGYLLIALTTLGVSAFGFWYGRIQAARPMAEQLQGEKVSRVIAFGYPVLLFAILFLFSKRSVYRVIIVIAAVAIAYFNIRRILHY